MGDGIGPELSESAISVLNTINEKFDLKFEITKLSAGDKALEETGKALPENVIDIIKNIIYFKIHRMKMRLADTNRS